MHSGKCSVLFFSFFFSEKLFLDLKEKSHAMSLCVVSVIRLFFKEYVSVDAGKKRLPGALREMLF